ncbi:MAG: transposase [Acetobacteraceae bacterium]|nr:transposase [Acetobacteraceae bacterium]
MLRAAHRCSRVHRHGLAGDKPVEQHPHGSELLLHTRRPVFLLKFAHPGADIERPNSRKRQSAVLAPSKKSAAGAARLARLKAIGPQIAAVLYLEGLYRTFSNRREVAAYAGLVPTPWRAARSIASKVSRNPATAVCARS